MVQPESRSMLQSVLRTWKNNHGTLLLVIGLVAAATMSGVTYFKLLPDIELIDDEAFARQLALSPASPRMKVDVFIAGDLPTSKAEAPIEVVGYIMVFPAFGFLEATKEPLLIKRFVLSETGVALQTCELPTVSQYAIVAYIDKNDNQQLDFNRGLVDDRDAEVNDNQDGASDAWPLEPFRFSNEPGVPPRDLSLKPAAIAHGGTGRILVHFAFGQKALSQ